MPEMDGFEATRLIRQAEAKHAALTTLSAAAPPPAPAATCHNVIGWRSQATHTSAPISPCSVAQDCHMPEMDGFEATRLIRQAEAKPAALTMLSSAAPPPALSMINAAAPPPASASATTVHSPAGQAAGSSAGASALVAGSSIPSARVCREDGDRGVDCECADE